VAIEPVPNRWGEEPWGEAQLTAYARWWRARRRPMKVRPPVSVASVVLTTMPCIAIVVAFIREFF
jgi:hypothetical protein